MSPAKVCSICFCLIAMAALSAMADMVESADMVEKSPTCAEQNASSSSLKITDATKKVDMIGRLMLVSGKSKPCGLIELATPKLSPFKSPVVLNNTWRIVCDHQRDVFVVLMSLHLSSEDYLQIKLKKISGEIGKRFHSLHFSKRSVLISIASDSNRDVFEQQSSFLLGYMCVGSNQSLLDKAKDMLEKDTVLEYLRCRPQSFEKLASDLASGTTYNTNDTDILNILNLKNDKEIEYPLPCTNKPLVTEWMESSAEGPDQ